MVAVDAAITALTRNAPLSVRQPVEAVNNLSNVQVNAESLRSRIMDADYCRTSGWRAPGVSQAAAMLAQANNCRSGPFVAAVIWHPFSKLERLTRES